MSRRTLSLALASVLLLTGCQGGSDHAHDAEGGHAEEGEHGHGHGGGIVVTHFTPRSELFVEWPPFARGEPSAFAVHLTNLASFRPIADGTVVVRLIGANGREHD